MKNIKRYGFLCLLTLLMLNSKAQDRPMIWVTMNEREAILEKIEKQPWADSLYHAFLQRLNIEFSEYERNPQAFLRNMPFDWEKASENATPPFIKVDYSIPGHGQIAKNHMRYLQVAVDCGMTYYLTQDEKYARCALDILHAYVNGISQLDLDKDTNNGGWLYAGGQHLREAREIGAQIPIIYDFVSPYIKQGGMPYDPGKKTNIEFDLEKAQQVFRTYVQLAIERGHTGSNWSVLESPSMVQNLLALEDNTEREAFIQIYLSEGSDKQDPLTAVASEFKIEGDVWPETSQYSNGVAQLTTYLMTILTKYDPALHLGRKFKNIPLALSRWEDMKYPNNEIVRFGDGHRYGGTSYSACEVAYYLGKIDNVPELVEKNGSLIRTAIEEDKYDRGNLGGRPLQARPYFEPLALLWFLGEIQGNIDIKELPRTDHLRHASLFLQRNLSETQKPEDGFMCFVAGAHMVHGHASGMDMELYGKGEVLGIDNGRGGYTQEIHENYYRLFAAHNSVIVNGSSQSEGGWVNLGINPVQLETMEPMPHEKAVSPYHSFTQTSFVDDKGDKAEAFQLRTLALVRTSPTSGYYVDVFRSKSNLPNQYHDYLYHNIGDRVEFLNNDLELISEPERYMANAGEPWVQNRQFRHPGWHYFQDVQTSSVYHKDVMARFSVEKLEKGSVYMNLYIPGDDSREYTRVMAPRDNEAPGPYREMTVPIVVIRKKGEAWDNPFVVVYEPFDKNRTNNTIRSVEKLVYNGVYKGVKVTSDTGNQTLVQYIITQPENEVFRDDEADISFTGTFAIVTTDLNGKALNLYMGDGKKLSYGGITIRTKKTNAGTYLDLTVEKPQLISNKNGKAFFSIDK